MTEHLKALLSQVESSVDAEQSLTRTRPSGFEERAEFTFGEYGWCVRVNVRNTQARGRGSRAFYGAQGDGETPELAVASFIERLPFFVQASAR